MRETFWMYGSTNQGDSMYVSFTGFWKMLCYKDTKEPVTGEKIRVDYYEYSKGGK
jgi:hypothetical protein